MAESRGKTKGSGDDPHRQPPKKVGSLSRVQKDAGRESTEGAKSLPPKTPPPKDPFLASLFRQQEQQGKQGKTTKDLSELLSIKVRQQSHIKRQSSRQQEDLSPSLTTPITQGNVREALPREARRGNETEVRRLLATVGDANLQQQRDGTTPLILATEGGHLGTVRALLAAGAKPEIERFDGETALSIATKQGRKDICTLLNTALREALLDAAFRGDVEKLERVMFISCDVNVQRQGDGATPLILATEAGHMQLVNILLDWGAEVNAQTKLGETALHLAVQSQNRALVTLLHQRGASMHLPNSKGHTPVSLAFNIGFGDILGDIVDDRANRNRGQISKIVVRNCLSFTDEFTVRVGDELDYSMLTLSDDVTPVQTKEILLLLESSIMAWCSVTGEGMSEEEKGSMLLHQVLSLMKRVVIVAPNEDQESVFLTEIATFGGGTGCFGLFADKELNKSGQWLAFFADGNDKSLYIAKAAQIYKVKMADLRGQHMSHGVSHSLRNLNTIDTECTNFMREYILAHLPLGVCREEAYEAAFPLLLSGVPKELLLQCASPALPELVLEDQHKSLYRNPTRKRKFHVDELSHTAKYFDLVARILEYMTLNRGGNRCVILESPDRYMVPSFIQRFMRMVHNKCREGGLQIVFAAVSKDTAAFCCDLTICI